MGTKIEARMNDLRPEGARERYTVRTGHSYASSGKETCRDQKRRPRNTEGEEQVGGAKSAEAKERRRFGDGWVEVRVKRRSK